MEGTGFVDKENAGWKRESFLPPAESMFSLPEVGDWGKVNANLRTKGSFCPFSLRG